MPNKRAERKKNYKDKQDHKKLKRHTGSIRLNQYGTGFITHPDFDADIRIQSHDTNTALHNDMVEFCILSKRSGEELHGAVMKIVERNKTKYVGTIERKPNEPHAILVPDDRKMYQDIFLPKVGKHVRDGYKAVVQMNNWKDPKKNPSGKVERMLGKKGAIDAEMHAIVLDNNLDLEFPKAVEKQARQIKKNAGKIMREAIPERRDLRDIDTFTIDPFDAKDFDDALSFRKLNDQEFELGIHIADVSAYVKPGTPMDREARKRAFTIYLVDRTIPMLPEVLANELCSLRPGEDKLAYSVIVHMNHQGKIKQTWFGRTVIHSDRRFNYEEAQKIMDSGKGDFYKELRLLNSVAKKIRHRRFQNGAIDFDKPEVQFRLDKKGHPVEVVKKHRVDTHKLIEEYMILANNEVAKFLGKTKGKQPKFPCMYRIHDTPKEKKAEKLIAVLLDLGYAVHTENGVIPATEINAILHEVKGEPEESLINRLALDSMAKAQYSIKNIGHYGLALKHYGHFTSPIRRYADVVNHRLLDKKIDKEKISKKEIKNYIELGTHLSERELRVNDAQYDSIALKQTEYMLDHKDQEFEGVITGIQKFGMFVQIVATQADGLIHISELDDDFYEMDKHEHVLIGKRRHKKYMIGDTITVTIKGGNTDNRQLDLAIVE